MIDQIRTALTQLDVSDDAHWTFDGLPKLDVLAALAGVERVKRSELVKIAPVFTRENPSLEGSVSSIEPEPAVVEEVTEVLTLESAQEEVALATACLIAAQQRKLAADQALDILLVAEAKEVHPHENQIAIMEYIATQTRLREERAARSPLDVALGNRPRGYSRA